MNTSIRKSLTLLSLLALIAAPLIASAIAYNPPILINNPTPEFAELFGYSVSISGDKFIVGAPSADLGAGSAYLYDATTGALLHTFNNPTPEVADYFGFSVSISGDKVLIGAWGDNTGASAAGSAYLYDATTGALLQTFNNPTPEASDLFGHSVSIFGDKVLIGAVYDNAGSPYSGAAYLFDATTGALLQTLISPTPAQSDLFGSSVSISGDKVLIGANENDTGAYNAGSAYLYNATTGTLLQTFSNPTPAASDNFGYSVSISGDKVLIGARGDDTDAENTGSAYLFDATTGALLQAFNNPTPEYSDFFGHSVSISGDKVLIGAVHDSTGFSFFTPSVGSAYLFGATTGTLLQTFSNPTPAASDNFGYSVSISGDKVLVGALNDDTGAYNAGAAYLYNPLPDTDGDGIADSVDNCPADANADQTDTDGDGQGNVCDFTPNGDTDGDGIDNLADNCPTVANAGQEDNDGDGVGNACDATPNGDTDGDGVDNFIDNCPTIANSNQADTDSDGSGDVCDSTPNGDIDNDGVDNSADNCLTIANAGQEDTDNDGIGNACDATPNGDTDSDGIDNLADNCPSIANAGQEDTDGDGIGNACDVTPNGDPVVINDCRTLDWRRYGFNNQGQCVAFVNTGHDSR